MPRNSSSDQLHSLSRREFIAGSSAMLVAASLDGPLQSAAESSNGSIAAKLAIHGGEKAVKHSQKLPIRWGDPERERLNATISQDSLFYWKGPQTALLLDRV